MEKNSILEKLTMEQASYEFQLEVFKEEHSFDVQSLLLLLMKHRENIDNPHDMTLYGLLNLINKNKLLEV